MHPTTTSNNKQHVSQKNLPFFLVLVKFYISIPAITVDVLTFYEKTYRFFDILCKYPLPRKQILFFGRGDINIYLFF